MSDIQVKYNGNPNQGRAYSVTADNIEVASLPLVFLEGKGVNIDETNAQQVEGYGRVLQQAFAKAYATTDVAALKAGLESGRETSVPILGDRAGRRLTQVSKDPFAGFHLQCRLAERNNNAFATLGFYKDRAPELAVA